MGPPSQHEAPFWRGRPPRSGRQTSIRDGQFIHARNGASYRAPEIHRPAGKGGGRIGEEADRWRGSVLGLTRITRRDRQPCLLWRPSHRISQPPACTIRTGHSSLCPVSLLSFFEADYFSFFLSSFLAGLCAFFLPLPLLWLRSSSYSLLVASWSANRALPFSS